MIETNPDTIEAEVSRKRVEALDEDRFYRALIERDASFEGLFFVGVTTTGIFCRPTCAARKPRRENARFFASPRDALMHGYRPCKVCRPMAPKGSFPDWLSPLMEEVAADPDIRLRAADLRARGADPDRVRRWFKANHGITFHAYLRAVRIGRAYGRIIQGDSVTDAAFDSGYESLSGFTHSFKRNTGFAPKHSAERHMITVGRIATPLGPMLAGVALFD